jgi:hypothetical protein
MSKVGVILQVSEIEVLVKVTNEVKRNSENIGKVKSQIPALFACNLDVTFTFP